MYRSREEYNEISRVVAEIYVDYGITSKDFPLDEKEICRKMGVELIPYSEYGRDEKQYLLKRSRFGFFVRETNENPPMIFYNDELGPRGAIRFTVFHELKHYVSDDDDESQDDLAVFFARYFMCPIPYAILMKISTPDKIIQGFGVSFAAAKNICSALKNRRNVYGDKLFEEEIPLIEQLKPECIEFFELCI